MVQKTEAAENHSYTPASSKRKARGKKLEFFGWGSKQLIEFLESIGKDTSTQISRYDVEDSIKTYVQENNLQQQMKKRKIVCDHRLHSLFGKKIIDRIHIYDMLAAHYAENQEGDDDFSSSTDEEQHRSLASERKSNQKKKIEKTPKSSFASVVPDNIKLVYLKRSLVQEFLKEPDTFEAKIIGSFARIKSDPLDYSQKNRYMLVQVTGVKKVPETNDILLQVSNFIKDVSISMLSDEDFSQEECEDLNSRVKEGLLERPTLVELEEKAQTLHEDVTKHWLAGEIALLQRLIDRANEKGWRKELLEYLERKQFLETPAEQSRLLYEVPEVVAEELELEPVPVEFTDNIEKGKNGSPMSSFQGASKITVPQTSADEPLSTWVSFGENSAGTQHVVKISKHNQTEVEAWNGQEKNNSGGLFGRVVIDISDDEKENSNAGNMNQDYNIGSKIWHYMDPQGDIQGPFSLMSLKHWRDADYFPPDFKVWKTTQTRRNAVLLNDILRRMFPG